MAKKKDAVVGTRLSDTLEGIAQAWRLEATADFDGDGDADMLWRNESQGLLTVWEMDGATATAKYSFGLPGDWDLV